VRSLTEKGNFAKDYLKPVSFIYFFLNLYKRFKSERDFSRKLKEIDVKVGK